MEEGLARELEKASIALRMRSAQHSTAREFSWFYGFDELLLLWIYVFMDFMLLWISCFYAFHALWILGTYAFMEFMEP